VNVNTTTRQDIALEIGAASEQVTITADTIQVETQTGALGEVISGQQVRELPLNGRSFVQLTQLVPALPRRTILIARTKAVRRRRFFGQRKLGTIELVFDRRCEQQ
jgi:hypothetical protein